MLVASERVTPGYVRQVRSDNRGRAARICLSSISQLPRVSGRDTHQLPTLRGNGPRYVDVLGTGGSADALIW